MTTKYKIQEVQAALTWLGYYDGPVDGNAMSTNFRDDLKRFQRDYGLDVDGWYGAQSETKLTPLIQLCTRAGVAAAPGSHLLRWQCTAYYIGDVSRYSATMPKVPLMDVNGKTIAMVPWRAFCEAALEGTTKLVDGRVVNVAPNGTHVSCDAGTFEPVFDFAKKQGWLPDRPGYAGIFVDKAVTRAVKACAFEVVPTSPAGFPSVNGVECSPFRTLAADVGVRSYTKHDPSFKGKGGVVPRGTRVFILEYFGQELPDGTTHDGWFTVNDTGGGIFGAHFDVFTGTRTLLDTGPKTPSRAHIWFEGCESKLGFNYTYGL